MPRFVEVAKKSHVPENSVIGVEAEGKITRAREPERRDLRAR